MSKNIYLLPGFALDPEIFSKLEISGNLHFMSWLDPLQDEKLEAYAERMIANYKIQSGENTVLIGHSFGGMVVQIIASLLEVELVILLASVKSADEKPLSFKMIPVLPYQRWFSKAMVTQSVGIWGRFHGYNTPEKVAAFQDMVNNKSDYYMQWSLQQILDWEAPKFSAKLVHLHGDQDKTFFINRIKEPIIISGGHHLLPLQKPKEVSKIINEVLMG